MIDALIKTIQDRIASLFELFILRILRYLTDTNGNVSRIQAAQEFKQSIELLLKENNQAHFLYLPFKDALRKAKADERLLVVYFHAPRHLRSVQVIDKIISHPNFTELFDHELYLWGGSIERCDAYELSMALQIQILPCLAILAPVITRGKLNIKVVSILPLVESTCVLDRVITDVKQAKQKHSIQRQEALARQYEIDETRKLREEQDKALAESLRIDREREAKRLAEQQKKKETEAAALALQEAKVTRIRDIKNALGDEPKLCQETVSIKFNFPNGKSAVRIFHLNSTIQVVKGFVELFIFDNELGISNFKLASSFPRLELPPSEADKEDTLESKGLKGRVAFFVQDLDS